MQGEVGVGQEAGRSLSTLTPALPDGFFLVGFDFLLLTWLVCGLDQARSSVLNHCSHRQFILMMVTLFIRQGKKQL